MMFLFTLVFIIFVHSHVFGLSNVITRKERLM